MIRFLTVVAMVLAFYVSAAVAQNFTALARLDPAKSFVDDNRRTTDIGLALSQPVPYRVRLLADPARLVIDFRTAVLDRLVAEGFQGKSRRIAAVRHGTVEGGWSRLILELAVPMSVVQAGMSTNPVDGSADIALTLTEVTMDRFRALVSPSLLQPTAPLPVPTMPQNRFVIALDPGHGGVDPGAVRDGVREADLTLSLARALRDVLRRSGEVEVILTRDSDSFVSLEGRIATAKRAGATVFVSLHADALAEGGARGAQVYTLTPGAQERATIQLSERHDRADLLGGVDLSAQDDGVARVLMSMARTETAPRAQALADTLVSGLQQSGVRLHRNPRAEAPFSVLKSADMPSVLVEIGFMSDPGELAQLQSPAWRAQAAQGLAQGLLQWRSAEDSQAGLSRR